MLPRTLFVTGTDTGVGKTLVSAVLMLGLKASYWKPVQTGVEDSLSDIDWIKEATQLQGKFFIKEQFSFQRPLSPHAAAFLEGKKIDFSMFQLPIVSTEYLIVEGAGGLMVPLDDKHFMIDLIKKLNLPALIVARSSLGTINHTLLSLEQPRNYKVPILGVVLNGPKNPLNKEAIEMYGKVKVIAEIEPLDTINRDQILSVYKKCFQKT